MAAVTLVVRDALVPHKVSWAGGHSRLFCQTCDVVFFAGDIFRTASGRCPYEILGSVPWPG